MNNIKYPSSLIRLAEKVRKKNSPVPLNSDQIVKHFAIGGWVLWFSLAHLYSHSTILTGHNSNLIAFYNLMLKVWCALFILGKPSYTRTTNCSKMSWGKLISLIYTLLKNYILKFDITSLACYQLTKQTLFVTT